MLAPLPSADIIGSFTSGFPAAISNEYGQGGAIMIASMFFAQYEKTGDSVSRALMQDWLNERGVCNSVQVVCPADDHAADCVEVCKLESEGEREDVVLYVLNHNEGKVDLSCTLSPELTRSRQSVNELCGNTCIKLHHGADGFARFALSLEAQEFAVLVFA